MKNEGMGTKYNEWRTKEREREREREREGEGGT